MVQSIVIASARLVLGSRTESFPNLFYNFHEQNRELNILDLLY